MKRACLALFVLVACGGHPQSQPTRAVIPTRRSARARWLRRAGPQGPTRPSLRRAPDVDRGAKLLEQGDLPGAKTAFEAAVAKNKDDAEAHYYLGLIADQQGDKAKAEKEYGDALRVRPHLEAAAVNLGALYIDSGRLDDALRITQGPRSRRTARSCRQLGGSAGAKKAAARSRAARSSRPPGSWRRRMPWWPSPTACGSGSEDRPMPPRRASRLRAISRATTWASSPCRLRAEERRHLRRLHRHFRPRHRQEGRCRKAPAHPAPCASWARQARCARRSPGRGEEQEPGYGPRAFLGRGASPRTASARTPSRSTRPT